VAAYTGSELPKSCKSVSEHTPPLAPNRSLAAAQFIFVMWLFLSSLVNEILKILSQLKPYCQLLKVIFLHHSRWLLPELYHSHQLFSRQIDLSKWQIQ
jgi:hypothetical protein